MLSNHFVIHQYFRTLVYANVQSLEGIWTSAYLNVCFAIMVFLPTNTDRNFLVAPISANEDQSATSNFRARSFLQF